VAVPLSVVAADQTTVRPAAGATAFTIEELASHGDRPALLTADSVLSYTELARLVRERAHEIGGTRRLVLLSAARNVSSVVTYLAALTSGHAVLLAPEDDSTAFATLAERYSPDVVAGASSDWRPRHTRQGTAHDLHPDLALLLSTSGSTGSAKLVRLSHDNVRANASSIAEYLDIRDTDRAIASLPLHYCYGLSVLHSHLLRGAGLVLTDRSVVDPCFWELFSRHQATTFAGVPHTFALLERVGFDRMELPSLRYLTQAGGRLGPDQVVRFAELGRRSGWDLYVMYGQTEATARMAYLPPDLATTAPGAIGRPIPGGSLRVEPVAPFDEPGVGELVYTGPNVMLGYAERPADLSAGRVLHELRTGDLGRQTDDGLFEVVGRLSRFVKVLGLRVDLEHVEATLAGLGVAAACAGTDDQLVVVAEGSPHRRLREVAAAAAGLPKRRVRVLSVQQLPRLTSGKVDTRAVADLAEEDASRSSSADRRDQVASRAAVRALYAELLDRPHVSDDDSFVSLDGDSLSYVEVSLRLEELLGRLPEGWHLLSVRELADRSAPCEAALAADRDGGGAASRRDHRGRRLARRAGDDLGGAHVLLALAGHGFGRFHLATKSRSLRTRHLLASVARIAVPSAVWIAGAALLFGELSWRNVVLLNSLLGPDTWDTTWQYWFVETLVHIVLAMTALLSIPALHRAERMAPFAFRWPWSDSGC
jgi:acyl-CoA synthetase (AMP-forming)/AMP-acid ligase II/acyl carrier protein